LVRAATTVTTIGRSDMWRTARETYRYFASWQPVALLSVVVLGLFMGFAIVAFIGVMLGWWDMPNPGGEAHFVNPRVNPRR
jgi:hypothetical protein